MESVLFVNETVSTLRTDEEEVLGLLSIGRSGV